MHGNQWAQYSLEGARPPYPFRVAQIIERLVNTKGMSLQDNQSNLSRGD